MTRDDIIRMAREAGLTVQSPSWGYTEHYHFAGFEQPFERFAALVAAAEREACAKICDKTRYKGGHPLDDWQTRLYYDSAAEHCAFAIRARGE